MELCNQAYKMTLLGLLKFECISLYGRIFLAKKPPLKQDSKNYLHLGCGSNFIESNFNAKTSDIKLSNIKFPAGGGGILTS